MIPIALILTCIGVAILFYGGKVLWEAAESTRNITKLQRQVEDLREALDDMLIGNVDKAQIRALLRRNFAPRD